MYAEGALVGEYTLQRKLGQGPLAEVWKATKAGRVQPAALKLLRPGVLSPSAMREAFDRLVHQLSIVGRLQHPHLPAPLGTVRRPSDGLFGLAAPYLEGGPLFDAGDLSDPDALHDALELIIQLGQTVMWLHEQGQVHGAIKPGNVLATPSADGPAIRLLDFCWSRAGLCRLEGTRFEPPEFRRGEPTEASDQWAVGRMLRVLVARRAPEPVSAWARLPVDLRVAVERSSAENPAQRFERVAQLVDALVSAQGALASSGSKAPSPADRLPAPTVPLEPRGGSGVRTPRGSDSVDITRPADPMVVPADHRPSGSSPEAAPPTAPISPTTAPGIIDAPTAPTLSDADPAKLKASANRPRMVAIAEIQNPDPTSPVSVDRIDPSADSGPPSGLVRPVVAPADPTAPVSYDPPRVGLPIAIVVLIAAVVAVGVTVWSAVSAPPEALVVVEPRVEAPPPISALPPRTSPDTGPGRPSAEDSPRSRGEVADPPPPPRRDTPDPLATARRDCNRGVIRACLAVSQRHERNRQWRAAAVVRQRACREGHRASCFAAAESLLKSGQGRAARRQYEMLCDDRQAVACAELARLYREGIGGSANGRTARAFVTRACKLGHRPSCP